MSTYEYINHLSPPIIEFANSIQDSLTPRTEADFCINAIHSPSQSCNSAKINAQEGLYAHIKGIYAQWEYEGMKPVLQEIRRIHIKSCISARPDAGKRVACGV